MTLYIGGHFAKVKSSAGVRRVLNHNMRASKAGCSKVIPEKAGQNIIEVIQDYKTVRSQVKKAKSTAVDLLDLVVYVSHEAKIDMSEFHSEMKALASKKYGLGLVSVCTHDDEKSLHAHISFVPLYKKEDGSMGLSARRYLGEREDLSRLQSELGQLGRKWGLVRGESAVLTQSKHETVGTRRAKLSRVRLDKEPDPVPATVPLLAGRKVAEDYREQAAAAVRFANAARLAACDAEADAAKLKKEKESQARKIAQLDEENRRLRAATDALRALDLVHVMQSLGYEIEKVEGKETVFKTSDGHVSINREAHIFSCDWSKGGRGALDLVMQVEKVDYATARNILETRMGEGAGVRATLADVKSVPALTLSVDDEIAARAAPVEDSSKVREYLIGRGIDAKLVDAAIAKKRIWQNQYGACCFETRDERGNRSGCIVRATRGGFKQTVGKVGQGFKIKLGVGLDPLHIVCESPVDALSTATLIRREGWPVSDAVVIHGLGGAQSLPDSLNDPKTIAFFDADPAGKRGSRKCLYAPPRAVSRVLPYGAFVAASKPIKDYNEILSQGIEKAKLAWLYAIKFLESRLKGLPAPELLTEKDAQNLENYKTAAQIRDSKNRKNREIGKPPKMG